MQYLNDLLRIYSDLLNFRLTTHRRQRLFGLNDAFASFAAFAPLAVYLGVQSKYDIFLFFFALICIWSLLIQCFDSKLSNYNYFLPFLVFWIFSALIIDLFFTMTEILTSLNWKHILFSTVLCCGLAGWKSRKEPLYGIDWFLLFPESLDHIFN